MRPGSQSAGDALANTKQTGLTGVPFQAPRIVRYKSFRTNGNGSNKTFSSNEKVASPADVMNEDIQRSIDAFKNRQIYDSFDLETLAGIPDDKLEQAVLDFVCNQIGHDFSREVEVVKQLSSGLKAIYTTMVVEGEVNNGGFNQYFWNSEGRLAEIAVAGFREIGALQFESLLRRAILMWNGEHSVWKRFKAAGTLEAFGETYKYTSLGELDKEFYGLAKALDLSQHRINYIRQHPHEFVTSSDTGGRETGSL
jgi:hypothetical protein